MDSLGEYLKREREYRNISLGEVSQATKVRQEILSALEDDSLDSRVPPVFVRGFLRAYAKYVGLNPDEVVLRYEASTKEEKDLTSRRMTGGTSTQWIVKYVLLPVSTLVLVGILLFLTLPRQGTTDRGRDKERTPRLEAGVETRSQPSPPSGSVVSTPSLREGPPLAVTPLPLPNRPGVPPQPKIRSDIRLELKALEETWLRIQIDQQPPKEILLRQGEVLSRRGEKNIRMTIGNAGGLQVLWNGKNLGKLGDTGKVVHLSITPGGVKIRGPSRVRPDTP